MYEASPVSVPQPFINTEYLPSAWAGKYTVRLIALTLVSNADFGKHLT